MRIRGGDAADLDAIARIHAQSWQDSYRGILEDAYLDGPVVQDRREVWAKRLAAPPQRSALLVAEDPDIAGFCHVLPDGAPGWLMLDNLHVSASHRGQGIGLALMRAMGEAVAALGLRQVRLLVLAENTGACRFYERLGGVRQPVIMNGVAGLGPFASIPFTWTDFPAVMARQAAA